MWILVQTLALAAPIQVQIAGVGGGVGVSAVVQGAGSAVVVGCADDGVAPDAVVDGRWTCGPAEVSGPTVTVTPIVDGRAGAGGGTDDPWSSGTGVVALQVSRGVSTVSVDPKSLVPVAPTGASPLIPLIVARVVGASDQGAPVVTLSTGAGVTQLACRDDGRFPDVKRNDSEPTCAGVSTASAAGIALQSGAGTRADFGQITWPSGAVRYVTLDVAHTTLATEPFSLVDVADASAAGEQGGPEPRRAEADRDASGKSPAKASRWTVALWIAGVFGTIAAGGLGLRRFSPRRSDAANAFKRHPATALFPDGPSLSDEAVLLRTQDPVALAGELLGLLARLRRTVVLVPPDVTLPPAGPCTVWVSKTQDWERALAGIVELAESEGPELAVLVVGAEAIQEAGAVAPNPVQRLLAGLPPGIWLGVIVGLEETLPVWLPQWSVTGPPWRATSVSKS